MAHFLFNLTRHEFRDFVAAHLETAERQAARYFLSISLINLCLDATATLAMLLIGMPSTLIWRMIAFPANFLLYVGPATLILALGIAGLAVFDGLYCLMPPLAFLFLNLLESQFVTTSVLGRQMSANPLLILLSLGFFLWLWGPV